MRQIYNTAESPEMAFFEMMDVAQPSSVGGANNVCDSAAKLSTKNESLPTCGQNRNSLRLTLANLLPSRLALFFLLRIKLIILSSKNTPHLFFSYV